MNEINFGMDGMTLDGTYWHNPKTGDSFKISSNYFEDNRMIIVTADGRRFDMDKMSNYVQTKTLVPKSNPEEKPISKSDLPPEVASIIDDGAQTENIDDYMDPADLAMIQGLDTPASLDSHNIRRIQIPTYQPPVSQNADIIERALNKSKKPDWVLTMKWTKFPQKELDMLLTVMDVPVEDIEEYYLNHIRTEFDDFMSNLKNQLGDYIEKKLKGDESETTTKKSTKRTKQS